MECTTVAAKAVRREAHMSVPGTHFKGRTATAIGLVLITLAVSAAVFLPPIMLALLLVGALLLPVASSLAPGVPDVAAVHELPSPPTSPRAPPRS